MCYNVFLSTDTIRYVSVVIPLGNTGHVFVHKRHVTSNIWNKWLVRHTCLISCFSQQKRTSTGCRRFLHVRGNLLPPLDIQTLDILSVKCLILLFEGKNILPDGYPCWQDGCLQIWQNPRWLPPWAKAMWSCPRART